MAIRQEAPLRPIGLLVIYRPFLSRGGKPGMMGEKLEKWNGGMVEWWKNPEYRNSHILLFQYFRYNCINSLFQHSPDDQLPMEILWNFMM
jgi:hypothetical protein